MGGFHQHVEKIPRRMGLGCNEQRGRPGERSKRGAEEKEEQRQQVEWAALASGMCSRSQSIHGSISIGSIVWQRRLSGLRGPRVQDSKMAVTTKAAVEVRVARTQAAAGGRHVGGQVAGPMKGREWKRGGIRWCIDSRRRIEAARPSCRRVGPCCSANFHRQSGRAAPTPLYGGATKRRRVEHLWKAGALS
jgi:hypothetical protein